MNSKVIAHSHTHNPATARLQGGGELRGQRRHRHGRDASVLIAYVFHFPPSEIREMQLSELDFWAAEAGKITKATVRKHPVSKDQKDCRHKREREDASSDQQQASDELDN
jgi:hypothetical protein